MRRLSFLWRYLRRHPVRLYTGIASVLGSVVVGMATPLLVGGAVDQFRTNPTSRVLVTYGGLLVLVAAVRGAFTNAQRMLLVTLSRDVEQELRDDYFAHLATQPQRFFHRHATGDLLARATSDLQAVRMLCGPAIMYTANTVFTAVLTLYFLFDIHAGLSLAALAPMPFVALATRVFGARIHQHFERVQEQFAALSSRVQENLAGLRVVRAYAREDRERRVFAAANDELVSRHRSLIRWTSAFHPLLQGLVGVGFVIVLGYGGGLVVEGVITIGEFVTFNFFLTKLVWPMIAIGWVINLAERGLASLARIRRILETSGAGEQPSPEEAGVPGFRESVAGHLRFTDLDFSYPSVENGSQLQVPVNGSVEPALAGLTLDIAAGTTVAIVGHTGSGKSTLLSLLPRLIDPPPGAVTLDGVDLLDWPLDRLRAAIAMVPQETFLFSVTVGENIAFGQPEAGEEQIRRAAELAGLESDLSSFPRGLDTIVGERGITLSGGQKQRVALARAILCDAPILLLDDCLSAVDTQTEERILTNLRTVFPGRTVLLVSHRISAVRDADEIVVLDGGRIAERGTHDGLVAHDGLYADLDRRQRLEEELQAI